MRAHAQCWFGFGAGGRVGRIALRVRTSAPVFERSVRGPASAEALAGGPTRFSAIYVLRTAPPSLSVMLRMYTPSVRHSPIAGSVPETRTP